MRKQSFPDFEGLSSDLVKRIELMEAVVGNGRISFHHQDCQGKFRDIRALMPSFQVDGEQDGIWKTFFQCL